MGDETFEVGFTGVGRGGFDRRDHTGGRSARLVFSPEQVRFVPSWWLRFSVGELGISPSDVTFRPVNVQGSRYRLWKPDQLRVGLALLRTPPSVPLVLWPRTTDQGLAMIEAARTHGFTVEHQAQSLSFEQIDVLTR